MSDPQEPRPELQQALRFIAEEASRILAAKEVPDWVPPYLEQRAVPLSLAWQLDLGFLPAGTTERLVPDFDTAIEAGLAQPSPHGIYYPYDGRLLAYVRDVEGGLRGFYGRAMPGLDEVKWISPGTPEYRRNARVYGWPATPHAVPRFVVAVEGALDAAAIHAVQHPLRPLQAFAVCGTPSLHQVGLIYAAATTWNVPVWIAFDGDEGGEQATARWVLHSKTLGLPAPMILHLPHGDPASYLAEVGWDGWKALMREAAGGKTKGTL